MSDTQRISNGAEYVESLRGRDLKVYLLGERVEDPVDHPVIRPSINAMAATYELAVEEPELATAWSPLIGDRVNRFPHVTTSVEDVVLQNRMQRRLGQLTGTCFQRCVGMDAFNSLYSVTYEIDQRHGTDYHRRFGRVHPPRASAQNLVVGGAMTDPKGDRGAGPSGQQATRTCTCASSSAARTGWCIRGAKAHQTGCLNSHWIIVMPTMRLRPADRDYAVVAAIPVDDPGLTFICGRQSCDTRSAGGRRDRRRATPASPARRR